MGKNSIWLTKKHMRDRAIFFLVSVIIILILLAVIFSKMETVTETQEEAPVAEEKQEFEVETEPVVVEEILDEEIEEPPPAECTMLIKHAEDELLDAYKTQKEAKDEVRRLEEQLVKTNQKIDEGDVLVEQAQKMLDDAKECSE